MKCFYHTTEQAVAQCIDCGKGLCASCASKYELPICDSCNKKRKSIEIVQYIKPLIICAILYIIGTNLDFMGPTSAFNGYMVMSIYAGWKVIDQFIPNLFVWFNLKAILWYYLIRVAISMFIGAFTTPIYLIYCVVRVIKTI